MISPLQVFIVGAPRCATSALLGTLAQVTGLPVCGEGHLYPMLSVISGAVDQYLTSWRSARENPETLLAKANSERLRVNFCLAVKQETQRVLGPSFIDKTPGPAAITALPLTLVLWPNARIIFAKRRGIENVVSACTKFPHHPFGFNCRVWANSMAEWRQLPPKIKGRSIEIEQLDLERAPDNVARDIGGLLELSPEQVKKMATQFQTFRPESTNGERPSDHISLATTPWTREQRTKFLEICGEQMNAYGYSLDQGYFSDAKSSEARASAPLALTA